MIRHALIAVGLAASLMAMGPGENSPSPSTSTPAQTDPGTSEPVGSPGLAPDAPWPTMRHDTNNTGVSDIEGRYQGGKPWSFNTGRGIFSAPAVSADGLVYVGSAAESLYGLDAKTGKNEWSFQTNGIIDTTPALLAPGGQFGPTLTIGSGDAHIYKLRAGRGTARNQRPIWEFQPTFPPAGGQVPWWEGSPNVGPDGTIYQGNTGGGAYAINPDGTQKWAREIGYPVWTPPAIGLDGVTYWGSVSTKFFAVDPQGNLKWERSTLGYVTSAPALDQSGRLFAGSFDGKVYSLDSATGGVNWTFETDDHIYSSPALVGNGTDQESIIIGSTDGSIYSLSATGSLNWAFDTGAPVRSSPAVGRAPGGTGQIAYVGSSNGVIYALNVADGSLRWAFDTASSDPEMANRSELNSSPALGPEGVYIGSQDGMVWHVPYDYCTAQSRDQRCAQGQQAGLPADGTFVFPGTPGGNLVLDGSPGTISPAGVIIGKLVQRDDGRTVPARLVPVPDAKALVTVTPAIDMSVSLSGDGEYVFIRPHELLATDTEYTIKIAGVASVGGPRIANLSLGTGQLEAVSAEFKVRTTGDGVPWKPTETSDAVSGISISRLAVPYPPLMTSVNQIGFDFYDWIAGAVPVGEGPPVLWMIGSKPGPGGEPVADPVEHPFSLPLSGTLRGGTFDWATGPQTISFEFAAIPFDRFDLRGTFGKDGKIDADAQILGQAACERVPIYGPEIPLTGICDAQGIGTFSGTFTGEVTRSPALRRAPGVTAGEVTFTAPTSTQDGSVSVPISVRSGTSYKASEHFVSIMLLDADAGKPIVIDYHDLTDLASDSAGNIATATVTIPAGTSVPARVEAVVMTDAFPARRQLVAGGS